MDQAHPSSFVRLVAGGLRYLFCHFFQGGPTKPYKVLFYRGGVEANSLGKDPLLTTCVTRPR